MLICFHLSFTLDFENLDLMSVVVDATLALWIVSVLNVLSNNIIFRFFGVKVLKLEI